MYYLNSRYYDPEVGRFINADGLISTGQGILGNNMFAYCGNNTIKYSDSSGHSYETDGSGALQAAKVARDFVVIMGGAGASGAIGLSILGFSLTGLGALGFIGLNVYYVATFDTSKNTLPEPAPPPGPNATPKVKEKDDEKPTVIYRYYSSKTENLSPRPGIDYDGLSFSTRKPRPGVPAVVTTIEAVNSTVLLMAVPTGGAHVTIVPTTGTVGRWMEQGQDSIWSQTLADIVIEWDGD